MKQWYALRSHNKKESSAAALLERAAIEVYLPRVKYRRHPGNATVLEPFFPGYLFARLNPLEGEIRLASYTPGIHYVLGYLDQPWPVADGVILAIKQRLGQAREWSDLLDYRSGDRLVITSGPLRDMEAIFDRRLSASGRVLVLIQMLERLCRAELDIGQLRKVSEAADTP